MVKSTQNSLFIYDVIRIIERYVQDSLLVWKELIISNVTVFRNTIVYANKFDSLAKRKYMEKRKKCRFLLTFLIMISH